MKANEANHFLSPTKKPLSNYQIKECFFFVLVRILHPHKWSKMSERQTLAWSGQAGRHLESDGGINHV